MRAQQTKKDNPIATAFTVLFMVVIMGAFAVMVAIQFGWVPPALFGDARTTFDQPAAPPQAPPANPRGNQVVVPQQYDVQPDVRPHAPQPAPASNSDALVQPAPAPRPVIDHVQAEQLDAAAELAAAEAAQQQLDARRAAELAAPVKMDAQQVEQEYGRDPCHAPRADPKTCGRGIVEATPLNGETP